MNPNLPMSCPPTDVLLRLFDGARPPADGHDLLRHVAGCDDCRINLSTLPLLVTTHPAFDPDLGGDTRQLGPGSHPGDPGVIVVPPARWADGIDTPPTVRRFGRYEVVGVIGRGGMGEVVKALDPMMDRFVAIKAVAPGHHLSPDNRLRLVREAQLAARVGSEYVVPVFDMGEENSTPYLVMPYVRGRDLGHRLRRVGRIGLADALRVGRQTAAGLAAAHAQGIVHRDIKPNNIILELAETDAPVPVADDAAWEKVRITDFGVARVIGGQAITRPGQRLGTPEYMSPEQILDEPIDHRSDLYALGLVLYRMLAGRSPFDSKTAIGFIEHHVRTPPPRPSEFAPGVIPDWLEDLILQLLQKDPADRVQTAAEVVDRLAASAS